MEKKLSEKQRQALVLLTCGKGMTYKEIGEAIGVNTKTLWRWRNEPEFAEFQGELKRIEEERWLAIVDAAKASAKRLVDGDNVKMTEFVLKNAGYNPATKVEAEITNDIVINIGE